MTCSAPSSATGSPSRGRPRLLHLPRSSTRASAPTRSTPHRRLRVAAAGQNQDAGKACLKWLGSAEAQDAANNAADAPFIAANSGASTATYSDLQKKSVEVVGEAANIAQFLDRDTNADFANTVMIPSLQDFLKNPDDIDGITAASRNRPRRSSGADAPMSGAADEPRSADDDRAPRLSAPPGAGGEGACGTGDRIVVILMVAVPAILVLLLVWLPAFGSVALSFGKWNGFGGLDTHPVGRVPELPGHRHHLPAVLARDPAQPDLAGLPVRLPHAAGHAARRDPGPRDDGAAGSTRPRSTCPSCCPWR